jgi:hypothetical protein
MYPHLEHTTQVADRLAQSKFRNDNIVVFSSARRLQNWLFPQALHLNGLPHTSISSSFFVNIPIHFLL